MKRCQIESKIKLKMKYAPAISASVHIFAMIVPEKLEKNSGRLSVNGCLNIIDPVHFWGKLLGKFRQNGDWKLPEFSKIWFFDSKFLGLKYYWENSGRMAINNCLSFSLIQYFEGRILQLKTYQGKFKQIGDYELPEFFLKTSQENAGRLLTDDCLSFSLCFQKIFFKHRGFFYTWKIFRGLPI